MTKKDKMDKILEFVSRKYPNRSAYVYYDLGTKTVNVKIWKIENWDEAYGK